MQILLAFVAAVLASVAPTAAYALVLWWLDRYEKEPLALLAAAFLWGALPAVAVSLLTELIVRLPPAAFGNAAQLLDSSAVAPLAEEVAKAGALLAIFWLKRSEFDGVLDGIIYGGIVGFGFAMSENVLYLFGELASAGLLQFGILWALRALVFGLNHALFTAVTGVGLGLARLSRQAWRRWLFPVLGLGAAVALHAVHNLFSALAGAACWSLLISLACDWGGLIVIVAVMVLSWRQERQWLATQLWEETARGVIAVEEYGVLLSPAQRLERSWTLLSRHGWAAARAWSRRAGWATELAFKKQQLAAVGATAGEVADIDKLRTLLRGA